MSHVMMNEEVENIVKKKNPSFTKSQRIWIWLKVYTAHHMNNGVLTVQGQETPNNKQQARTN